ncbi:2-hydroxy-3-keto-5-methylthiopentenyl-1-phosphate phosphatase [Alkalihalophilus lindianensis]|uniref:2-hydroxy-3-keto-5-methylthiopentenyl-1-phosphate phosphatase n=1 Tax=Alkalihalophilus lindianensis TaxID=1630542 RepID=A0ABU3X744_9BACI|nr:2-hydroxy-3-keto-5-methylthiopentenyl-1-phosphate phosphatase [Alkalihalophilus lindianensis]MDV2683721.1 2-hydroxy-3-keto-5-methylthiopentenyl-1-phosphate phosphatase [Alkalihalophilus lindianensis]
MSQLDKRKLIIFCDFDGTITTKDNIIAIMKQFAPDGWEDIKDDILAERISIREGVGRLFSLIPVERKQEIIDFVLKQAEIREGFEPFLTYLKENDITFKVVSGGIDFFVQPVLEPYDVLEDLYCNGSDFNQDTITITWPHHCDSFCTNDCGCCKPSILRQYPNEEYYKIVIGDSITDLQAAKQADEVFACDNFLLEKCQELELNHSSFSTFYEVIESLKHKKEVTSR